MSSKLPIFLGLSIALGTGCIQKEELPKGQDARKLIEECLSVCEEAIQNGEKAGFRELPLMTTKPEGPNNEWKRCHVGMIDREGFQAEIIEGGKWRLECRARSSYGTIGFRRETDIRKEVVTVREEGDRCKVNEENAPTELCKKVRERFKQIWLTFTAKFRPETEKK